MARILGVSNSSPSDVLDLLKAKSIVESNKEVTILPVGTVITDTFKTKKILFVLVISDFIKNLDKFNEESFKEKVVVVFGSPIRLREFTGVTFLDFTIDPAAPGFGFHLSPKIDLAKIKVVLSKIPKKKNVVTRDIKKHLTILTDSVKKGSLLTPLMTFIYSLPSSSLQTPVKIVVAKVIANNLQLKAIDKELAKISDHYLTETSKARLYEVLESNVGVKYRNAFKEYNRIKKEKGTVSVSSLAKKLGVNEYEIKYILAILNESKALDIKAKKNE